MIRHLTKNARRPRGVWGRLMIAKMNHGHAKLTEWAMELLDIRPNGRVLDIGCGGGKAVAQLHRAVPGGRVYGVDYSPLAVKRASRENRAAIELGQVEILEASVSDLPFPDHSFQLATAIETVYFWPDLERDLREVHRVLTQDGCLAIICEMVSYEEEVPKQYEEVVELLEMRIPSAEGLERVLCDAGFSSARSWVHPDQGWICVIGEK